MGTQLAYIELCLSIAGLTRDQARRQVTVVTAANVARYQVQ